MSWSMVFQHLIYPVMSRIEEQWNEFGRRDKKVH